MRHLCAVWVLCSLAGCPAPEEAEWRVEMQNLTTGLTSIWGTSESDIFAVGGDNAGAGPLVMHWDGESWRTLQTSATGNFWWVFGFEGGPVFMGGSGGQIFRYRDGTFEKMTTPSTAGVVFGIWGSSPTNVWAVGGAIGGANGGFAWRLVGDEWQEAPGFPSAIRDTGAIWKVWGCGPNDVWLVGTFGLTVHWDGSVFTQPAPIVAESLFTVHCSGGRFAAVGGFGTGIALENDGSGWKNVSPPNALSLNGVYLTPNGGYASGLDGAVYARTDMGWQEIATGLEVFKTLHAVWVDPKGGIWAVGGDVSNEPLREGVLIHRTPGGSE